MIYKILIFLLLISFSSVWSTESLDVILEAQKVKEEWNFVNYRFYLTNVSNKPIQNPVITYYAKRDSSLSYGLDYVSYPHKVKAKIESYGDFSKLVFSSNGELSPRSMIELHFRIYKNNWSQLVLKEDWSYQKKDGVREPNYFVTVYDEHDDLLWGADPLNGEVKSDVILWYDDKDRTFVNSWDSVNDTLHQRFWVSKKSPLSLKEKRILSDYGIDHLETSVLNGNPFYLFSAKSVADKVLLDTNMYAFHNAFDANDSTGTKLKLNESDLYKEEVVCSNGGTNCINQVSLRRDFDLNIFCWPDVSINKCREYIETCSNKNPDIDHGRFIVNVGKDDISCLEKNNEIRFIDLQREEKPTMHTVREAVHINNLQNNSTWINALQANSVDYNWLSKTEYTGEGVVVGVYDTGIDFSHPDFNENDANKISQSRIADISEIYSSKPDSTIKARRKDFGGGHGTHVAGAIGGNGFSSRYKYRGIAPKVHFYPYYSFNNQNEIGSVVNHSHIMGDGSYVNGSKILDYRIYTDYKYNGTSSSDTLTKAVVYAAGNNGLDNQPGRGTAKGYHSILADAKNSISVGNYASLTGYRHNSSSMGPTLDGRIKPDVMAPGSAYQYFYDENKKFVVYIDYIKLYHKDTQIPYLDLNFEKNEISNEAFLSKNTIVKDNGVNVLKWEVSNPSQDASYAYWNIEDLLEEKTLKILDGDVIEVRYKFDENTFVPEILTGSFYVQNEDNKHFFISGFWNQERNSDGYSVTRWTWTNKLVNKAGDDIDQVSSDDLENIKRIRLDFNYSLGYVSTIPKGIYKPSNYSQYGDDKPYMHMGGTSMAAPVVSGIAALLYQKYASITKMPLNEKSLKNSTVKAILIHTAEDMINDTAEDMINEEENPLEKNPDITEYEFYYLLQENGFDLENKNLVKTLKTCFSIDCSEQNYLIHLLINLGKYDDYKIYCEDNGSCNIDSPSQKNILEYLAHNLIDVSGLGYNKEYQRCSFSYKDYLVRYSKGPDFATGWGKVNAEAALNQLDLDRVKEVLFTNETEKRWMMKVPKGQEKLRTTIAWDDYPGNENSSKYEKKLVNDLDLYLISPSGKIYYPWRLLPLPSENLNDGSDGLEKIRKVDVVDAENGCSFQNPYDSRCFDHLNNVEVVDIEKPESGIWEIAITGKNFHSSEMDNEYGQIISLVSDYKIEDGISEFVHPYLPLQQIKMTYELGKNLKSYVTFSQLCELGSGDYVTLYDEHDRSLGIYTGKMLAGKTISVNGSKLKVELVSDNDGVQGWGVKIDKVRNIPFSIPSSLLNQN